MAQEISDAVAMVRGASTEKLRSEKAELSVAV